ncbi:MAG TPA: GntR family transcriptional regulator [Pseudothermotoga sp.]|mgnify:CR=1 FL=1|nr:GntR family transcriptional regulator [Pseudothermotoga sp.]HOK83032.1 GntR family transcriptional regulator [Pseudothermotoga sp.]HPP69797.1 GntR family transcriptional regulator [Pseudothermotoga sp.]
MQKSYSVESIYKDLKTRIENGHYLKDNRLPDEKHLASLYGVGRQAVRMAIEKLVKEGVVKRVKGRGTFVLFAPKTQLLGLVDSSWSFQFLRRNLSNVPKECDYFNKNFPVLSFEILWHKESACTCFERCFVDPVKNPTALTLLQSQDNVHPMDFCVQKLNSAIVQDKIELVKPPRVVIKHLALHEPNVVIGRTVLLSNHVGELFGFSLLYYHPSVQITQIHKF